MYQKLPKLPLTGTHVYLWFCHSLTSSFHLDSPDSRPGRSNNRTMSGGRKIGGQYSLGCRQCLIPVLVPERIQLNRGAKSGGRAAPAKVARTVKEPAGPAYMANIDSLIDDSPATVLADNVFETTPFQELLDNLPPSVKTSGYLKVSYLLFTVCSHYLFRRKYRKRWQRV